jgi:predicted nuclease of predicted toxin-antitoxin system
MMTFLLDHDTPDDLVYSLRGLGHQIFHVREALSRKASDEDILTHAHARGWIVITCNRDDYLALARSHPHAGVILLIRRRTRVAERAARVQLLDKAGESGIANNINFA